MNYILLHKNLKVLREKSGLTYAQVLASTGIKASVMRKIENNYAEFEFKVYESLIMVYSGVLKTNLKIDVLNNFDFESWFKQKELDLIEQSVFDLHEKDNGKELINQINLLNDQKLVTDRLLKYRLNLVTKEIIDLEAELHQLKKNYSDTIQKLEKLKSERDEIEKSLELKRR